MATMTEAEKKAAQAAARAVGAEIKAAQDAMRRAPTPRHYEAAEKRAQKALDKVAKMRAPDMKAAAKEAGVLARHAKSGVGALEALRRKVAADAFKYARSEARMTETSRFLTGAPKGPNPFLPRQAPSIAPRPGLSRFGRAGAIVGGGMLAAGLIAKATGAKAADGAAAAESGAKSAQSDGAIVERAASGVGAAMAASYSWMKFSDARSYSGLSRSYGRLAGSAREAAVLAEQRQIRTGGLDRIERGRAARAGHDADTSRFRKKSANYAQSARRANLGGRIGGVVAAGLGAYAMGLFGGSAKAAPAGGRAHLDAAAKGRSAASGSRAGSRPADRAASPAERGGAISYRKADGTTVRATKAQAAAYRRRRK